MSKRNEVQLTIQDTIIKNNIRGIILASVRVGKTRIILNTIKKHSAGKNITIFIAYPNIDIKNSWIDEMEKLQYFPNVIFSTFISLDKHKETAISADYFVADEAHLIPLDNVLPVVATICENNIYCLLSSGTYSDETLSDLELYTGMSSIVSYTTEEAIKDGIINDFKIYVHTYNLDDVTKIEYGKVKKWNSTEKKEIGRLTRKIIFSSDREKMFHALARMRLINSCNSLVNKVKTWIRNNENKRFLLFCGDQKVGEKYNLPMFNSTSQNDDVLISFQKGTINQLCLIKKGSAGITYPNLNTILITAINSNGENLEQQIGRSLLLDTDNAEIHIFVSSEAFQLKWLDSALKGINKEKILYIK